MALPPLATVDELAVWLGVDITNEDRAEAILVAASTLIRTHTGRIWVDADGDPEADADPVKLDAVNTVCLSVAGRVYTNPDGTKQESIDGYSNTVADWAAFGLSLTDDEKAMVGGSSVGIPGLGSIRVETPAAAAGVRRSVWWDTEDEEEVEV